MLTNPVTGSWFPGTGANLSALLDIDFLAQILGGPQLHYAIGMFHHYSDHQQGSLL